MPDFDFATSTHIIFGCGAAKDIGKLASGLGKKVFLVVGSGRPDPSYLVDSVDNCGLEQISFVVNQEPSIDLVKNAFSIARKEKCDLVISFGGGSVLDTGKAVAAMLTNPGDLEDYLEVVGLGKQLTNRSANFIAIPTTAGTGSEVTRNAVIGVPNKQVKVSLRSALMLPTISLVDPELTLSMPPEVTAGTGMDALTQVLEPFVSKRANPMVDLFCREGLAKASRSLLRAYQDGDDLDARGDMSWVSLLGGLSLANGGLGTVHGIAGPFGGMFEAPHGAVCAALLSASVGVNIKAMQKREPENPALSRYLEVARILTGEQTSEINDGAVWLKEMCTSLKIPGLSCYGVRTPDLDLLIEKSINASSMRANPIQLQKEEIREIIELSL